MNQRKHIHTTLGPVTYNYFKAIQEEHDCNLNEAMDICVQRNVTMAQELKENLLHEVIDEVLRRYLVSDETEKIKQ